MSFSKPLFRFLLFTVFTYISFPGNSQAPLFQSSFDSVSHINDSLQDMKMVRMERELLLLKEQLKAFRKQIKQESDSLRKVNLAIQRDLSKQEKDRIKLEDGIIDLQNKLKQSNSNAEAYKMKLRTVFWISGPAFFTILLAFFLLLVFKNRRMKIHFMEQIEGVATFTNSELNQIRSDMREERIKEIEEYLKDNGKIRNKVIKEVRKGIKKDVKDGVSQSLSKGVRKVVKKEIRKRSGADIKEEIKKRMSGLRKKSKK